MQDSVDTVTAVRLNCLKNNGMPNCQSGITVLRSKIWLAFKKVVICIRTVVKFIARLRQSIHSGASALARQRSSITKEIW